jgi:hypothetical protein
MDYQFTEEEIQNEIFKIKEEESFKERVDKVVKIQLNDFDKELQNVYAFLEQEMETLHKGFKHFKTKFESLQKQHLELKLELSKKDDIIESLDKRIKVFEDDKEKQRLEQEERLEAIKKEKERIIEAEKDARNSLLEKKILKFLTEEKEKAVKLNFLRPCNKEIHNHLCCYKGHHYLNKEYTGKLQNIISKIIYDLFNGYDYKSSDILYPIYSIYASLFKQPFMLELFSKEIELVDKDKPEIFRTRTGYFGHTTSMNYFDRLLRSID